MDFKLSVNKGYSLPFGECIMRFARIAKFEKPGISKMIAVILGISAFTFVRRPDNN
jgi:hypothetical protein